MKKTLVLLLAAIMLVGVFAACAAPDPTGNYTIKTINGKTPIDYFKEEAEADDIDIVTLLSFIGLTEDKLNEFMTMTIEKGGKATITVFGEDPDEATWELKGSTLYLTADGETQELEYKNGTITIADGEMTYVLAKN